MLGALLGLGELGLRVLGGLICGVLGALGVLRRDLRGVQLGHGFVGCGLRGIRRVLRGLDGGQGVLRGLVGRLRLGEVALRVVEREVGGVRRILGVARRALGG